MKAEVFFTRPGIECEINDRMILDLKCAKKRILGSAYYLSEYNVKKAIKESEAPIKRFILNHELTDLKNNSSQIETLQDNIDCVIIGKSENPKIIMHHKFIIIDDVLWVGSLNLSKNATTNNWENMMRITDADILDKFYREFKRIYLWGKGKYEWDKYVVFNESSMTCNNCEETIDDITNHYPLCIKVYDNYYCDLDNDAYYNFCYFKSKYPDVNPIFSCTSVNPYFFERDLIYKYCCIESQVNFNLVCGCCNKVHRKEDLIIVEYHEIMHYRQVTIVNGEKQYEDLYDLAWLEWEFGAQQNSVLRNEVYCYNCLYDHIDSISINPDYHELLL